MKRLFLVTVLLAGCKPYKLEPPPGFAEVGSDAYGARMIAGDKVGLNLRVYDNVPGGTLAFWGQDLVRKLGMRQYALVKQTPVKSRNGVAGTRFDFDYVNPDGEAKFYSVVVFVTNKHLFALQVAGDEQHAQRYQSQLDTVVREAAVRGCRPWGGKPCRGPQPAPQSTPPRQDKDPNTQPEEAEDPAPHRGATPSKSRALAPHRGATPNKSRAPAPPPRRHPQQVRSPQRRHPSKGAAPAGGGAAKRRSPTQGEGAGGACDRARSFAATAARGSEARRRACEAACLSGGQVPP